MQATEDLRISSIREVITPASLHAEFPMTERAAETVVRNRSGVQRIIHGDDDRLLVVIGPCSITIRRPRKNTRHVCPGSARNCAETCSS